MEGVGLQVYRMTTGTLVSSFSDCWRASNVHRTGASCDWRWLQSVTVTVILLSTRRRLLRSVWTTNSVDTTSQRPTPRARRSFHLPSDRCRRPPCWTASRSIASSRGGRRWKRHRRCHGNRSRAVCSSRFPVRRSCSRTRPTTTDESMTLALQRVDDNLVYTPNNERLTVLDYWPPFADVIVKAARVVFLT